MPEPFVPVAVIVGFGLVARGLRWLNEGRPVDLGGLFADQRRDDWPHGVQEADAPRFRVDCIDRADRPRRSPATLEDLPTAAATGPRRERVTLRVQRSGAHR